MKTLLIVLDGAAGTAKHSELAAAKKPFLDMLAKRSKTGMTSVVPGIAPESDSAVLSLLGYDPFKYYTGRGPLEAEGFGIKFKRGMLALRCNFASSSDGSRLIDRRAGRSLTTEEAHELERVINEKVKLTDASFFFRSTVQHRAVLIIKAKRALSPDFTNTDPAYERGPKGIARALPKFPMRIMKARALTTRARRSAELINEFTEKAYEALKDCSVNKKRKKRGELPANVVLCRDAGNDVPALFSISKKYRKKWAILADMPLEVGIGKLAGMHVIPISFPAFTQEDFEERVKKTLAALKKFDAVYVHIKGPDLFGHDGNFRGKVLSIEQIDRYFIGPLLHRIDLHNTVIAVTSDHATPSRLAAHSSDAVPTLIFCRHWMPSNRAFNERECSKGFKITGNELVPLLMELTS
ncbi:MAG: alkaline phosphatase family protein [archaeon]